MKGAAARLACWLAVVGDLAALHLLTGSRAALCGLILLGTFSLLSALLNLVRRRDWTVHLSAPSVGEKGRPVCVSVKTACPGKIPAGTLAFSLVLENDLTGEGQTVALTMGHGQEREITFTTVHCGRMTVSVRHSFSLGLLGILPLSQKVQARCYVTVLPDTYTPEIDLTLPETASEDNETYAPDRRGNDPTELYQLRDYVPGDSLRQIHWKLSTKLDRPVVREASLPMARTLLVFWDKTGTTAPAVMDVQAEVLSSLCQTLCEMGRAFTLGWTEPEGAVFFPMGDSEALLQTLPMVLRGGCIQRRVPEELPEHYGKCICLGACVTDFIQEILTMQRGVLLLCGQEETELPTISYSPEDYQITLQRMEL